MIIHQSRKRSFWLHPSHLLGFFDSYLEISRIERRINDLVVQSPANGAAAGLGCGQVRVRTGPVVPIKLQRVVVEAGARGWDPFVLVHPGSKRLWVGARAGGSHLSRRKTLAARCLHSNSLCHVCLRPAAFACAPPSRGSRACCVARSPSAFSSQMCRKWGYRHARTRGI